MPPIRFAAFVLSLSPLLAGAGVFPGADERTPSRSEYFSWINHTNEGPTAQQTLANLAFFRWLHDRYGMELDLYAFDAGTVDGANFYGSLKSERFQRQFPDGFGPLARVAGEMGTRLGLWAGPDGFGTTREEEAARFADMVSLCRDFGFELFKMDAVCGPLRPEKQAVFDRMMTECRRHSPPLILLNHRLDLGPGNRHSTTYLLGGTETYIDVHLTNDRTASHHRAGALGRGLPPGLTRLTEDHGVCLSSCLDYWEDELVLQAFNRNLILAPQIYGNPWLLRDEEFPRLAAIFNLHRQYRDLLVDGFVLPASECGPGAVSRGNGHTRFITLRNLTWKPVRYTLTLDGSVGLTPTDRPLRLTQFHPWRQSRGRHSFGAKTDIEVLPFRTCLLRVTTEEATEPELEGGAYEVVRAVDGAPAEFRLLGWPGSSASYEWTGFTSSVRAVEVDGQDASKLLQDGRLPVSFGGAPLQQPWHREVAPFERVAVPGDAEALYEATCFAADNNALEVRSLARSGPTRVSVVEAARRAFFEQPLFGAREVWDRALFDEDETTAFSVNLRWGDPRVKGGAFRLDLGEVLQVDTIELVTFDEFALQPLKSEEGLTAQVSADLRTWREVRFLAGRRMVLRTGTVGPWRYLRFAPAPLRLSEIRGWVGGKRLDRTRWRASNLFAPYAETHWREDRVHRARAAWIATFSLPEVPAGSYLCVAVPGHHGREAVTAALRLGDVYVGSPDRSPSFPSNTWEAPVQPAEQNATFYLPLNPRMAGRQLQAVVLAFDPLALDLQPELWITAYPPPFASKTLRLIR